MARIYFDPRVENVEKVLVEPAPGPSEATVLAELKAKIANLVRANARERHAVTPAVAVAALAPEQPRERVAQVLADMSTEGGYADIKGVVAPSGRVYLYAGPWIDAEWAAGAARREECKWMLAEKVRADSRDLVAVTPATTLHELVPGYEPADIDAVLKEMAGDERFWDVKAIAARDGTVSYHSDAYLSGNYATILARANANVPCATIAETVRDASRMYPRPTKIELFREKAFGIDAEKLDALVEETLRTAEFADVKKMVHPATGAAYLYSEKYMTAEQAWFLMDWSEVGQAANP